VRQGEALGTKNFCAAMTASGHSDSYCRVGRTLAWTSIKIDVEGANCLVLPGRGRTAGGAPRSRAPCPCVSTMKDTTTLAFGYEFRDILSVLGRAGIGCSVSIHRTAEPIDGQASPAGRGTHIMATKAILSEQPHFN